MKIKQSWFVERDGKKVWLAPEVEPLPTDTIIEERPMLFAEEGKWLWDKRIEDYVGEAIWLRNGDTQDNYEERDIPPEPEPEEEDEPTV